MSSSEDRKKRRLWEVDPTIFQKDRRRGPFDRLVNFAGWTGRMVSLGLLLTYPLWLVLLGVVYGGIVFWGSFLGSILLIGVLIWKLGYAGNFDAWNPSLFRQVLGLFLGFLIAAGFYVGLSRLNIWMLPVLFGILSVGIVLMLRKEP